MGSGATRTAGRTTMSQTTLDLLPPAGAVLICPPLKIEKGSGSPLRVLALIGASA